MGTNSIKLGAQLDAVTKERDQHIAAGKELFSRLKAADNAVGQMIINLGLEAERIAREKGMDTSALHAAITKAQAGDLKALNAIAGEVGLLASQTKRPDPRL